MFRVFRLISFVQKHDNSSVIDRDDIGCIDPFEYISVHEYGQSVERARNGTLGISISWADGSTGEYTDCK